MSQDSKRISEAQVRRELMRMDDRAARRRMATGAVVIVALALLAGTLAARFLFIAADVRTDGMSPGLASGDVVFCLRTDAPFLQSGLRRGAPALVRYSESGIHRHTLRRLIALAGDEVSVDQEGRVTLNGEALEEPYATYCPVEELSIDEIIPGGALENPFAPADATAQGQARPTPVAGIDDLEYPRTVPDGAAFVLCDNRNNRLDSRSSRFGLVAEADIEGVAQAILWPVYRAGLTDGAPGVY
jgi:signal peptidase I